jgi:hypothetical protein
VGIGTSTDFDHERGKGDPLFPFEMTGIRVDALMTPNTRTYEKSKTETPKKEYSQEKEFVCREE